MLTDKEGILHIACRMIGSKVHFGEHMQIVFNLGTVGQNETHTRENVNNLVGHNGQRMACTQLNGVGSTRQVNGLTFVLLSLTIIAQLVDALCGQRFQFVDFHTNGLFLVGGYIAEIIHQGSDFAFLTEIFQSQLLYFLSVFSAQLLHLFQQFVYSVKYHHLELYLNLRAKLQNIY